MVKTCKDCGKEITTEYQNCKLITIGNCAYIYKICDKDLVRKKFFIKNNELNIKETLEKLNKPYLLKIHYSDDENIIYQYINGQNLYQYMNLNISISEYDKFILFYNIFKVLLDLEKSGFNHLDVSPYNIMLNDINQIFLIDYENLTNDSKNYSEFLGSYGYVPPEKIENDKFIFNKFDSYSLGILMADFISYGYNIKIKNFQKKCICWSECKNLQSCINRKILKILENINCLTIKKFYKTILTNTLVLDHNKRKSFTELEPLVKDLIK